MKDIEEDGSLYPEGTTEVSRITIVKVFDPIADGGFGIYTNYDGDMTAFDATALLAWALGQVRDDFEVDREQ